MKAKKSYENGGQVARRSTPGTAAIRRHKLKEENNRKAEAYRKSLEQRVEKEKADRRYSGSVPSTGKATTKAERDKYKTKKYKKGGFPDLTGDGKVTMADVLKGRGVGRK